MDEMGYKGVQLLIKNIPINVDDKSLREVFEEHGQVLELKIKTYGWFEQKHASVFYATKIHAENAFKKLNESSLGGNKIKANLIETLSHDRNASAFTDQKLQVNSKDNSKANPEVQDNSKVQDDSKTNTKVHNHSKVQDDSKASPTPNNNFKCEGRPNIYVSGLSQNVSESILQAAFEKYAKVESLTILKPSKWESDCNHGYVTLDSNASAEKVIHELNQTPICGKMITVNWAYDKSDDTCCVYISGLPRIVSEDHLRKQLLQYGRLLPRKIKLLKSAGKDELHTYVNYVCQESAKKAVQAMNWSKIFGKTITVILKCDINDSREIEKQLFVDHLPSTTDMVSIREVFQKYGEVTFVRIFRGDFGMYGYVRFSSKDSAEKALAAFNGEDVFGKNIRMSWSKSKPGSKIKDEQMKIETFEYENSSHKKSNDITASSYVQRQGLQKKSTKSQELELGKKASLKFQPNADYIKASTGRGKGSAASTKSSKTNTEVGKFKRQIEAANLVPLKVGGEGSTPMKTNSFGRGRGECRALHQSAGKPPPCMPGIKEDAGLFSRDLIDFSVPPPNIQTPTQSLTDKNFLANQSINHRFSSIVHKYSAMVLRPLSKEAISGIKYVLEVSLKGEMENLITCSRKLTKLKASVDGDGKANRTKKAVESLGMQLLQTLDAVDWTKLASFYNKSVTCPRAGTKMTEADVLCKLRREDERIWKAEGRVNQLINHLRSIVRAFEDVEENNGVNPAMDMELEDCLEKAQDCLDHPVESRDEEIIVWGKNKVEEILDEIDSAWNIVHEDSDVIKLLKTTENPLGLFEMKDSVKNKNISKSKGADLNGNKSLLSNKVKHFQSKNQLKGGFYDSNHCLREEKNQTKLGQKSTVKFKSTETGYMQVQEIKMLVETHTEQHISPQMRDLLRKLDRDQDGWIFYDEFEAALTPDLLNILAKN